jgi:segregation and condensation protein B
VAEDVETIAKAVEALIFSADRPSGAAQLRKVFPELSAAELAEIVNGINSRLLEQARPYEIVEVGGGYQFRTRPEYGELIRAARPERPARLSRAALETLAVVAYRQPFTRAELEELRCVDCGAVLKTLLERDLVRIVGRRDTPGRPALYGSTSRFLEIFGLRSLRDLPDLREVEEMLQVTGTPADAPEAAEDDLGRQDQTETQV